MKAGAKTILIREMWRLTSLEKMTTESPGRNWGLLNHNDILRQKFHRCVRGAGIFACLQKWRESDGFVEL